MKINRIIFINELKIISVEIYQVLICFKTQYDGTEQNQADDKADAEGAFNKLRNFFAVAREFMKVCRPDHVTLLLIEIL